MTNLQREKPKKKECDCQPTGKDYSKEAEQIDIDHTELMDRVAQQTSRESYTFEEGKEIVKSIQKKLEKQYSWEEEFWKSKKGKLFKIINGYGILDNLDKFISKELSQQKARLRERMEEMKRFDDAMPFDKSKIIGADYYWHGYNDAIDDILKALDDLEGK